MPDKSLRWRKLFTDCDGVPKNYKPVNDKCSSQKTPARRCQCDVDSYNEQDTVELYGVTDFWMHRCTMMDGGEPFTTRPSPANRPTTRLTVSYSHFESCFDVNIVESPGQYTFHHNTYMTGFRRMPKTNNAGATVHLYNNIIHNFGEEAITLHSGDTLDEFSRWSLDLAPFSSSSVCDGDLFTQIGLDTDYGKFSFTYSKGSCGPSKITPNYPYTVFYRPSLKTTCTSSGTRTCVAKENWYRYFYPPTNYKVAFQVNGAPTARSGQSGNVCSLPAIPDMINVAAEADGHIIGKNVHSLVFDE